MCGCVVSNVSASLDIKRSYKAGILKIRKGPIHRVPLSEPALFLEHEQSHPKLSGSTATCIQLKPFVLNYPQVDVSGEI